MMAIAFSVQGAQDLGLADMHGTESYEREQIALRLW